jgi:hypothetical protein
MRSLKLILGISLFLILISCGTLDNKTILINAGDSKERVLEVMGAPQDRQLQHKREAWQYCVSGAGFGYNDHKVIWFNEGIVTGITSYKTYSTGCTGDFKSIKWEEAPDLIIEQRVR